MGTKNEWAQWKLDLLARRLERDYARNPDAGLSCGPRKVHFANACTWDATYGVHVFAFGAYGCTYIVATGYLEDALEEAAAKLLEIAPGSFHEPQYAAEVVERFADGGVELDERENARLDALMDEAEADLTYTESGYLASWEWTIVGSDMTAAEIRTWAANK